MQLYTVHAHGVPLLVISAGAEPWMEDSFTRDPSLMEAHRKAQAWLKEMDVLSGDPEGLRRSCDVREIEEAIDTWLGEDLLNLEHDAQLLWSGDRKQLVVHEATADEAAKWHRSRLNISDDSEIDGSDNWLVYLVSVNDAELLS